MVACVSAFVLFGFVYYLFFNMVSEGGSMALEYDLSFSGGVGFAVLFFFDWASVMFSLSVLFISGSIFMYCCFYMRGEVYPERFCWLVGLFVLSMNLFVFMPSVMGMMLGWDGLGVVSFGLVSYYKNAESLGAGNITVLTGRVGDACLVVLVACTLSNMSWHWFDMQFLLGFWVMTCVMVASMTKSAQVPFSAWLPAAMAAPTPVSALVHSSTLVTAGVYVLYRYFSCVEGSWVVYVVFVSMLTMVLSGLVACVEGDLKKVVAFSTMSQLGVMVMGISAAGSKDVGMFHLLVHAYYKSLMFLCVGCVIFKGAGVQDSRFYSGLWMKMPIVGSWLVVACFALSAVPFTSGFYSKHAVVEGCLNGDMSCLGGVILCVSVFVTAFYSFRLLSMMFCSHSWGCIGKSVVEKDESGVGGSLYVFLPLFLLGLAAVVVGVGLLECFVLLNPYVFVPSYLKVVSFVMTILGCMLGVVNKLPSFLLLVAGVGKSKPFVYWGFSVSRCVKANWFLSFLSGNALASLLLILGSRVYLFLEKGWLESWFWKQGSDGLVSAGKVVYAVTHYPKVISLVFVFSSCLLVYGLRVW
nr:NADH dehydrogenase subunit 5 [Lithoredo abatanica]